MFRALKYLMAFSLPATAVLSFQSEGWMTYFTVLYAFGLIPFLEVVLPPDARNLAKAEEELIKDDPIYDWLLYLVVPVVYALSWAYFQSLSDPLTTADLVGRTLSFGIILGALGINVGHELGHRADKKEQLLAKLLLLPSFYMHFFIEHNRGHHKHVSTPDDPASARYGEWIFTFWVRSVVGSYLSAWRLENDRVRRNGLPFWQNEMIVYQVAQLGWLGLVYGIWGESALYLAVASGVIGFLLLETVNYIEHYGLQRERKSGHYERVMPHHSWNSDQVLGRLMLFELTRHSDHHYLANRKYQILRHQEHSPQMPAGYPAMMLLALVPPLWFPVMHRQIRKWQQEARQKM